MRAVLAPEPFDSPRYIFEAKWGGVRVVARIARRRVSFTTISGRDITHCIPQLARRLSKVVAMDGIVLDGEIVFRDGAGRPDPLRAMMLLSGGTEKAGLDPPVLYVNDVLYHGYRPVTTLPLVKRKLMLKEMISADDSVQESYHHEAEGTVFFEAACALGAEGMLAKSKTSRYEMGVISKHWLDISDRRTAEVVVGGFTMGAAAAKEPFEALLVGAYEGDRLRYLGSVSGGFSKKDRINLQALLSGSQTDESPFFEAPPLRELLYWCDPSIVVQIEYGEMGPSGQLRFGRYGHRRVDIDAVDCLVPVQRRGPTTRT